MMRRVLGAIARGLLVIARGMAAFLAAYTALSLFALVLGGSHNQNAWWIDLSILPAPVSLILQLVLVVVLLAFTVRVPRRRLARWLAAALCALFCLFAVLNIGAVYDAQAQGFVRLGFPLPFSFFIALIFAWLTLALLLGYRCLPRASGKGGGTNGGGDTRGGNGRTHSAPTRGWRTALGIFVTVVLMGVLFPLGQILCFGTTDYRQPVDAVVVFGAQVFPDGTPSLALQDRLDAAIDIYEQGYTPVLIMSGGVDIDGVSEAVAMKDYAVSRGVPEQVIELDEYGDSTQATAHNTIEMARRQNYEQLGVTSSFYHMARIKMLYLANGVDVLTMPAPLDERDGSIPFTTLREIPGWWYYWFTNIAT
jgi:vancomycin permeability regulator SanA